MRPQPNQSPNHPMQRLAGNVLGLAVVLTVLQPAAADAAERYQTVRYAAAELSTETGVASVYRRLQHAARQVCFADRARTVDVSRAARNCYTASLARAVQDTGSELLAEVHERRPIDRVPSLVRR